MRASDSQSGTRAFSSKRKPTIVNTSNKCAESETIIVRLQQSARSWADACVWNVTNFRACALFRCHQLRVAVRKSPLLFTHILVWKNHLQQRLAARNYATVSNRMTICRADTIVPPTRSWCMCRTRQSNNLNIRMRRRQLICTRKCMLYKGFIMIKLKYRKYSTTHIQFSWTFCI